MAHFLFRHSRAGGNSVCLINPAKRDDILQWMLRSLLFSLDSRLRGNGGER